MKLIVGLGNPGSSYETTRHNVGFRVVDRLALTCQFKFKSKSLFAFGDCEIEMERVRVIKPLALMNRSGWALRECLKALPDANLSNVLVVVDDVNLPLGLLRFRARGSAGGHHGLESIISEFGESGFPRLRIGIGREGLSGTDLTDYVLGEFTKSEQEPLQEVLKKAERACMDWVCRGPRFVMDLYNRRAGKP